jgi:hypothetical protein
VTFGTVSVTSFSIDSDTQIRVTAPAHAVGTVDVTVTTQGVTSSTSAADQFTYTASVPVVTNVAPNWGPTYGWTWVFITGSGFTGASDVEFGASPALWLFVYSDTQIGAYSPPEPASTVDIIVVTAAGSSGLVPEDHFTYGDLGHGGGGGGYSSRARHVGEPPAGGRVRSHHPRHVRRPRRHRHRAQRLDRVLLTRQLRTLEAFFAEGITIG